MRKKAQTSRTASTRASCFPLVSFYCAGLEGCSLSLTSCDASMCVLTTVPTVLLLFMRPQLLQLLLSSCQRLPFFSAFELRISCRNCHLFNFGGSLLHMKRTHKPSNKTQNTAWSFTNQRGTFRVKHLPLGPKTNNPFFKLFFFQKQSLACL